MADTRVLRYRGKPVEDLTREELLLTVYALMDMIERQDRWANAKRSLDDAFKEAFSRG